MNDIIGAGILLVLFLSVISVVEILTRQGKLKAETARKSIHLIGGLGCMLFPFLITSWVTVAILALLFALTFYFGENGGHIQSLSSVERTSIGSLLFPLAILLLFIISEGKIWIYVSALAVLVLADTAAALTGVRFGKILYSTGPNEKKSLEGTLAFCLVGFLSVLIPLITLSDISIPACILTSLLMSFLLAALEAVSIAGTDNLYVPLSTVYLLRIVPTKPELEIVFQCLSLLGISIILFIENRRQETLHTRPLILFLLTAYAAWSLGSPEWMIPIVVGFIFYNRFCKNCTILPNLSARELLRPLYPSIGILFLANSTFSFDFWFTPFAVATSSATSLCITNRFRKEPTPCRLNKRHEITASVFPMLLSVLLCIPFLTGNVAISLLWTIPLCTLITVFYNRLTPAALRPFTWNYAIPFLAGASATMYALLQYFNLAPILSPLTWAEVFR